MENEVTEPGRVKLEAVIPPEKDGWVFGARVYRFLGDDVPADPRPVLICTTHKPGDEYCTAAWAGIAPGTPINMASLASCFHPEENPADERLLKLLNLEVVYE